MKNKHLWELKIPIHASLSYVSFSLSRSNYYPEFGAYHAIHVFTLLLCVYEFISNRICVIFKTL